MYVSDESQTDIAEAIADVIENYPVDESRIVLAGFSMGGLRRPSDVLRDTRKFRALVVFSGDPDLANRWSDGGAHPNFSDDDLLTGFGDVRSSSTTASRTATPRSRRRRWSCRS